MKRKMVTLKKKSEEKRAQVTDIPKGFFSPRGSTVMDNGDEDG